MMTAMTATTATTCSAGMCGADAAFAPMLPLVKFQLLLKALETLASHPPFAALLVLFAVLVVATHDKLSAMRALWSSGGHSAVVAAPLPAVAPASLETSAGDAALRASAALPKVPRAAISFERRTGGGGGGGFAVSPLAAARIEALLHHVCALPDVGALHFDGVEYLPAFGGAVRMDLDVWFELRQSVVTPAATTTHAPGAAPLSFVLKTYEHDVGHLHKFVDTTVARHKQEKAAALGFGTYFFDMVTSATRGPVGTRVPTSECLFTRTDFATNRTLSNVFFPAAATLRARVAHFRDNREWYTRHGVPWTLGLTLWGTPGGGKCVGVDTPIMMADGSVKPVQDVVVGDRLMGDDSDSRHVLSLARGREPLYRVRQAQGDPYVVNESHILSLKRYMSETPTRAVVDISVRDYLALPLHAQEALKGYRVGTTFPARAVPVDPYLVGYWLGGGSPTEPVMSATEPVVVDYLRTAVAQLGLQLVNDANERDWRIRPDITKSLSHAFTGFLRTFNLVNNKHIPEVYRCNARAVQLQVLAGLLDAVGQHAYEITLDNERLLDGVIYIARSLGFAAFKSTVCTTVENAPGPTRCYRTTIHGLGVDAIPVKVPRKCTPSANASELNDALMTDITLEPLGEGDYYGFEIDGNHRFLLGDYTVTHNTSCLKALASELGRHIFNVSLPAVRTKEALKRLFYSDEVTVVSLDGNRTETLYVPVAKRLYVLDDVDVAGSIALKRAVREALRATDGSGGSGSSGGSGGSIGGLGAPPVTASMLPVGAGPFSLEARVAAAQRQRALDGGTDVAAEDEVDLATFLEVLDGVRESPGRVAVMCSNRVEALDEALLRAGRCGDLVIEFCKHNREQLLQHVLAFYSDGDGRDDDAALTAALTTLRDTPSLDRKWAPAEVAHILFEYLHDPAGAVDALVHQSPQERFALSYVMEGVPLADQQLMSALVELPSSVPTEATAPGAPVATELAYF